MKALKVKQKGEIVIREVPIPSVPEGWMLIKTKAVALNPTDWKHIDFVDCGDATIGCDYAGVVEVVGAGLRKVWKKGDRVVGFVHGGNRLVSQSGAFAEYVLARGDIQLRVPESMSFEAASTLGVGIFTVSQNLYQSLDLPHPKAKSGENSLKTNGSKPWILIYGGATATGTLAIQFAKLSGMRVVTTCSDSNQSFLYSLGADLVLDYSDADVGVRIREQTHDSLELVLDTVSSPQTAGICEAAISSAGGCYNALHDVKCLRDDIDSQVSMAYDMLGNSRGYQGQVVGPNASNFAFSVKWCETVEALLQASQIRVHPYRVMPDGLQGIPNGLQLLREGKVRASKLVYQIN